MDIYIYVFQCDLKNTKNKEIMDLFRADILTGTTTVTIAKYVCTENLRRMKYAKY